MEKCFGISKAAESDCANRAGTHSCAGLSQEDYSGGEWTPVPAGICVEVGGQLEAFDGNGQPVEG